MKDFILVMKALSDPNRVTILKLLQHMVLCVCELQELLGIAQPTVSKHLKQLEKAGLVSSYKDGLWVNYRLSDGSSSPYAASILGNLKHWLSDEKRIREIVAKTPSVDRKDICGHPSNCRSRMSKGKKAV